MKYRNLIPKLALALFTVAIIIGYQNCGKDTPQNISLEKPEEGGIDDPVRRFLVTTLESGPGNSGKAGRELRLLVISQPEIFEEIYGEIGPTPPVVDFTQHRVIIALMGEKSSTGYDIRFAESAQQRGQTIEVQVLRTTPEGGSIGPYVMTYPYVIAIIPRDHYTEIVFVDELGTVLANVVM